MAINVTIADDSKMSRKSVMRALPDEWDVNIHEATNGKEAIVNYAQGLADVMFLDLTMPEMDGFQVLEHLHEIDAKSVVIVISADIQPYAQERVKQLGAASFIQKPLDPAQLKHVLHGVGLL
ncbi:response regulator [Vibrio mangrovi]|uniref:Chemotaxis protein CheY n=1 Tax=Vibrio mangrovi TaxID=474394 RepID=A0A1Y6IQP4_9VIBR|nr:response regulator [Vibrio mangrovi]MDW6004379.1 response regulator [Vibrio mangrovi]SMR98822.1 Chemotaxis protein CheY [Vibrio mangrovi]